MIAIVERDHGWADRQAVPLEELAGRRLVLREIGSTTRRLFETAMRTCGLALGEVLAVNSRDAVREMVAAGFGIAVVSDCW